MTRRPAAWAPSIAWALPVVLAVVSFAPLRGAVQQAPAGSATSAAVTTGVREAAWSPDGTRIAFTSSRDGTNGVYTMKADGSDVRDVSRTPLTLAMRPRITVLDVNESLWAWR